jgi:hypothetical protein
MTLDTIIFNEVTVGRMLTWLIAVGISLLLFKLYKSMFAKKKSKPSAYRLFCMPPLRMGRPHQ